MNGSDVVSLVDLWRVIVRRKAIIFASFLISVLLALAYLFFAEPLYKANAYLLPPHQQKIQGLLIDYRGIPGIDVNRYTQQNVFKAFLENLNSQGLRREFFENHHLIDHYVSGASATNINADRVFNELFNERLDTQVDKQNVSFVTVSLSDSDPKLAAQWLNEIIDFADKRTVHQLFNDVNAAVQSEIGQVRYQLHSKLNMAEQRKRDKILELKEALQIAKTLGIDDTGTFPKMTEKTQLGLAVNTAEVPLYMQGTKALETEISVLEARKSEEPFIGGFRDLQERKAYLEAILIDPETLSAITVDEAARVPYRAVKPRWALTILLAAALGLVIGVFTVFIKESISRVR